LLWYADEMSLRAFPVSAGYLCHSPLLTNLLFPRRLDLLNHDYNALAANRLAMIGAQVVWPVYPIF
jgi:hypothetical protein